MWKLAWGVCAGMWLWVLTVLAILAIVGIIYLIVNS